MILITNISDYRFAMSTVTREGRGVPIAVELPPKNKVPNSTQITNDQLHNWPMGAKQQLADYVGMGVVRVDVLRNVHDAPDRRVVPLMEGTPTNLLAMIASAVWLKTFFNEHMNSTAWHNAPGATVVTAADSTDWATTYVLVADEQAQYAAHLGAVIHTNPDTVNTLTLPPPASPEQAVAALQELFSRLGLHKTFTLPPIAPALSPAAILAY